MSHNIEEQEMEAEALSAIFPDAFEVRQSSQPFVWSIKLVPVDTDGDAKRCEKENHVGVHLVATLPKDYPESATPEFDIEVLKASLLYNLSNFSDSQHLILPFNRALQMNNEKFC